MKASTMVMIVVAVVAVVATAQTGVQKPKRFITYHSLKLQKIGHPITCPNPDVLFKNKDKHWAAPGGWQSFDTSFSKNLYHLIGLQWQGDKIGKIFCSYKDNSKLTFPVNLQAPGLYIAPEPGQYWQQHKGYISCSHKIQQNCFFQRVKQAQIDLNTDEDVTDFLQSIKKGVAGDNN